MFGGSTAFGIGVPDDQTVASHLQTQLGTARDGREVRVYNFGRGAYYSSQERALFERLIVAGYVPNLAIFLDGLNDFFFYDQDRPSADRGPRATDGTDRAGAGRHWASRCAATSGRWRTRRCSTSCRS